MSNNPRTNFAQQLVADGRRDREVLRRRWHVPSWRAEIERIANLLERIPLLIPAVEQAIDEEMARLWDADELSPSNPPFTEAPNDADRQETTLSDVQPQPAPQ